MSLEIVSDKTLPGPSGLKQSSSGELVRIRDRTPQRNDRGRMTTIENNFAAFYPASGLLTDYSNLQTTFQRLSQKRTDPNQRQPDFVGHYDFSLFAQAWAGLEFYKIANGWSQGVDVGNRCLRDWYQLHDFAHAGKCYEYFSRPFS